MRTADHLKQYQFKKGQSGNPAGRPPGKSLKEFAREYFDSMTEEERIKFLNSVDRELAWRMAEGNPQEKIDHTSKGEKIIGMAIVQPHGEDSSSSPADETV